jgi:hypothetical protein
MKEALSSSEPSVLTTAHGVTSQKTSFFIVTAVKTSYLTMKADLLGMELWLQWEIQQVNRW